MNTKKVIELSEMFNGCNSLEELNLSNFNTNKVTDMRYMFCQCFSLKKLNLSNFNTNNGTNMEFMFYRCFSLKELKTFDEKIKEEYQKLYNYPILIE